MFSRLRKSAFAEWSWITYWSQSRSVFVVVMTIFAEQFFFDQRRIDIADTINLMIICVKGLVLKHFQLQLRSLWSRIKKLFLWLNCRRAKMEEETLNQVNSSTGKTFEREPKCQNLYFYNLMTLNLRMVFFIFCSLSILWFERWRN